MQIFTQTNHISEEALGLHAMNDLPQSRCGQVVAHLSSCDRCRNELLEVQEIIEMLRLAAKAQ